MRKFQNSEAGRVVPLWQGIAGFRIQTALLRMTYFCATFRRNPGTTSLTVTDWNGMGWTSPPSAPFSFIVQGQKYLSIRGDRRTNAPWEWWDIYLKLPERNLTNLRYVSNSFPSLIIFHSWFLYSRFFFSSNRYTMAVLIRHYLGMCS